MRWGRWYAHDAQTLIHRDSGLECPTDVLWEPVSIAEWCLRNQAALTAADVVHLTIAANDLCSQSWCFDGVGDWCNAEGSYRGAPREEMARAG